MNQTFLGIERSLNGARWVTPQTNEQAISQMMAQCDIPEIVARLLINRGITPDGAQDFLNPELKNIPDPYTLKDMEPLSHFLAEAVMHKKSLGIFGDFDVDGATSSAILHRFFAVFGLEVPITIPDRLTDGYGPNIDALTNMQQSGIETIIIADCGITSHDVIEAGKNLGLEIIILDHHEPQSDKPLPPADFIIDPKRSDDTSGLDDLCAAGVCWMTCYATGKELLMRGHVANKQELGLGGLLDLVAFGTVCDMVPLRGINRILVSTGMKIMQKRANIGINALCNAMKLDTDKEIDSFHLGFGFGPRINAGSRMHDSSLGAKLLSTNDEREALEIAQFLDELNEQRKTLSNDLQKTALQTLETANDFDPRITIVSLPEADGDVKGLVATSLCQKYNRPALALMPKVRENGEVLLTGSARSVKGFDIAAMMFAATEEGLLLKGGGHAMAGGCTMEETKLSALMEWLPSYLDQVGAPQEYQKELMLDGLITAQGASVHAIKTLQNAAPFGQENRAPKFALAEVMIYDAKPVGGDGSHISCRISDKEGGASLKAIAFRAAEKPLGIALLKNARENRPMHIAGELDINEWQGRENAQIKIEDGAEVAVF